MIKKHWLLKTDNQNIMQTEKQGNIKFKLWRINNIHNEKEISGSQIQYIHITKPELTRIKDPCLQKLVTWFELKKLINSIIVSMDN